MSRPLLYALVALVVLVAGAIALSFVNSEVPLTRIEQPLDGNATAN